MGIKAHFREDRKFIVELVFLFGSIDSNFLRNVYFIKILDRQRCAKVLIDDGAHANATNANKKTPLHIVSKQSKS